MSLVGTDEDGELFRTLFDTAPDAMVVVDRDGLIVLANPQAHRLFGFAGNDLPGQSIETLLPEGMRAAHARHRNQYMAKPTVRPMGAGYELTGLRHNGETFPVEVALSPIGHALFAASIRDISESQRVRRALQRTRYDTHLAQLGKLLIESPRDESARTTVPALIAQALGVAAVVVATGLPDSDVLSIRASYGIRGQLADGLMQAFTADRLTGRLRTIRPESVWTLARSPKDDLTALRALLREHGFGDAAILPLLDRHGPAGVLLALTREQDNYDNDESSFLLQAANILAAAIQRNRSEEQLAHAQRLDALGKLTGGIAHDFNNLLTIVSGNLQMLETTIEGRPESRALVDSALRAVHHGASLTRKLLGFSRRRALTPRALNPRQVLDGLGNMLAHTLGAGIRLTLDCPPDVPTVLADPGELETALLNLAINARDAMPKGGSLRIIARERLIDPSVTDGLPPGQYVAFTVADTGTGMTHEVLKQALDPFFTTKEAHRGNGLGLSMVYGFVRQSGGRVRIESMPGQGTRVEMLLPASSGDEEDPAEADGGTAPATVSTAPNHIRVLVVEDEPEVRAAVVGLLRTLGYDPREAGNAAQALDRLHEDPTISLLFSDVALGRGHTGFELVREARVMRPGLPVLLTSGNAQASAEAEATRRSGVLLLTKPYARAQLADALKKALESAPHR